MRDDILLGGIANPDVQSPAIPGAGKAQPATANPTTPKRPGRPPGASSRRGARNGGVKARRKTTPEERAAKRATRSTAKGKRRRSRRTAGDKPTRAKPKARPPNTAPRIPKNNSPSGLGAPTKYRRDFDETAKGMALLGFTDDQIAEAFDVTGETIRQWKKRNPTFAASIKAGKISADAQVAASLFHRATGYSHPDVKIFFREGDKEPFYVPVVKYYPPETAAAIFWLKNRQGQRWREKQLVEVADPLASQTPEQRLAHVKQLVERARAVLAQPGDDDVTDAEFKEIGD